MRDGIWDDERTSSSTINGGGGGEEKEGGGMDEERRDGELWVGLGLVGGACVDGRAKSPKETRRGETRMMFLGSWERVSLA
jgi:hypothetical protein